MKIERSESGSPIIRHEAQKHEWEVPNYGDELELNKIEEHVEKYIGEIESVFHEVLSDTIHLDVLYIKPSENRDYHSFVTLGMSNIAMNPIEGAEDDKYSELMICLPKDWKVSDEDFKNEEYYWPIRWLKILARFPHENNSWLSFGHTIPNGDPAMPFTEGTKLSSMLLLPPVGVDNEFWNLEISDSKNVKFYNLVPLYQEELNYKLKNGVDSLFDKFEEINLGLVLDVNRKNSCKKKFLFF